jgi:DNA repair exonuclease SbcCD nuclease subunit
MMFHHGLEGQVARYAGALRYQDLLPLHQAGVDYLALGHIHRCYTEAGWIFNPGSIEANSVSENQRQNPRGVYLVTLGPELGIEGIHAELKSDYYQRPILRLQLTANPKQTLEQLESEAITLVRQQKHTQEAIVELRITGQVGFQRLDLDVRTLQQTLQELSGALIFLLKYEVLSTQFDTAIPLPDQTHSRMELEELVFTDLFASLELYRPQAPVLAHGLIELKDKILANSPDAELYAAAQHLSQHFTDEEISEEIS